MQLFHKRDFTKARELFERATIGPLPEMAHSAHMHLRMCDRRLSATQLALKTPEDHYTFGITLMNQGKLEQAQQHLQKAAAGRPDADHFHYGLALCCGLRGDFQTSAAHLKRAIELAPANRIAARNDPEFQAIAAHSPLREVLYPERGRTA